MLHRENIKAKVDKLDKNDLRIVELLIDSLKRNKTTTANKPVHSTNYPYLKVIELMGQHSLTSDDISQGREERL